MNRQYLISEQELKQLEDARLLLVGLERHVPTIAEFELSKVRSTLWKTVNLLREEGSPTVSTYHL